MLWLLAAIASNPALAFTPVQESSVKLPNGFFVGSTKVNDGSTLRVNMHLSGSLDKLRGDFDTPYGDAPITKATSESDGVHLTISFQGQSGTVVVTKAGDRIAGHWEYGPLNGTLNMARYAYSDVADRSARWRGDLQFMVEELKARHPNLYHHVSRTTFEAAVTRLNSRIPALSDDGVKAELLHLTAMLGEGHTWIKCYECFKFVPLSLDWFGKDLRVMLAPEPFAAVVGARVLNINGFSLAAAEKKLLPYISQAETSTYTKEAISYFLTNAEFIHAIGLGPSPDWTTFTLRTQFGLRTTIRIPSSPTAFNRKDWVHPYKRAPLYRASKDQLSFAGLKNNSGVYVNMRGYGEEYTFAKFWKSVFDFVDQHKSRALIVDLRQNNGGDFNYVRNYVIPDIHKRPQLKLGVLIASETYSAAVINAEDFRDAGAVLFGSRTRGRPNNYQDAQYFTLPYSRLVVSYASRYIKSQPKDTNGIIPNVPVEISWPDYVAGRDPVLAKALVNAR